MSGRQKQNPPHNATSAGSPHHRSSPVFSGQPHGQNLAVQRSLMEIFDEFTEVVSGELKSMNFEEAEQFRHSKD